MARRGRHSTSTVTDDARIVPWLAASGPLSYTPEAPPESDYYFQYGWVMPGTLSDGVSRRRHYYFGAIIRDRTERVYSFWKAARARAVTRVALLLGSAAADSVRAPFQRVGSRDAQTESGRVFAHYSRVQGHVLSDSTLSFNSIHDRAKRTETGHIRDGTWITDHIARDNGLDLTGDALAKRLWLTTHQSFTLNEGIAKWKFGPNYIKCRTPLDNIRLTTFFAGEHEARIVDPDRVEFLECVGCRLETRPSMTVD
jgi:hypothetical protein